MRPLILLLFLLPLPAFPQSAANVLLVINDTSPASVEIGAYYAEKRSIPAENILRLRLDDAETISREGFQRGIEAPLGNWLARNSAHDRILYIVLTKGIPLRIAGTEGPDGTAASVDSELALLYRKMSGVQVLQPGRVANPYFLGNGSIAEARRFTHRDQDIFLVCRLDGFTVEDVRGLIDRGASPSSGGRVLLKGKGSGTEKGEDWLRSAAAALGERALWDASPETPRPEAPLLGYFSWGSNDPAIRQRKTGLSFIPGALGGMFVSSDARTMQAPPAGWQTGAWQDRGSYYAGSPQSLTGDLIQDGITGAAGNVSEQYLEGTVRPDILFPAYLAGFNLAEAFYLATPFLSWQGVVIGDPLCAPFQRDALPSGDLDPGIDPETEHPRFLSQRRTRTITIEAFQRASAHPETVKALLRSEARLQKGDLPGARAALEEATSRDSRLLAAQVYLAQIYEQAGDHGLAVERYRRILELQPENVMALNNLAYSLAARMDQPKEALPLAEKAYSLAKGNANITDTLGWIHHLLGESEKAYGLISQAALAEPRNAEIQLHLAIVAAATERLLEASTALSRAVALDPLLESRDEVKSLRQKIK